MKPKPLAVTATVVGVVLAMMWWRQSSLEEEILALRVALAESPVAPPTASPQTAPAEAPVATSPHEPFTPRVEVMGNEDDRITDLERVVNGQADVLEEMLARFAVQEEKDRKARARAWGPEQVIGPPDTMTAGDQRTAWAPAVADGGEQWLQAEFAKPVEIAQVIVRQTCNPGTITKVVMVSETGAEVPIWEGQDPSRGQMLSDTPFAPSGSMTGNRVKVYLNTGQVAGWEEIDAVQLVGRDGTRQWAKSASASSTYAGGSLNSETTLSLKDGAQASPLWKEFENTGRTNLWSLPVDNLGIARQPERRRYEN